MNEVQLSLFDFPVKPSVEPKLFVSEIFGPTIQGEGPSAGRRAVFLRLGGCHLHCVFCDSAYTWRFSKRHDHNIPIVYNAKEEIRTMTIDEVASLLVTHGLEGRTILVITGGEPLLQPSGIQALLDYLARHTPWDGPVEIETSGTRFPLDDAQCSSLQYNVSPKLANSGMTEKERTDDGVLQEFAMQAATSWKFDTSVVFKFVASSVADLDEISDLVGRHNIPNSRVFVMPEGIDHPTLTRRLQELAGPVIARGWNLSHRLHILLWGNVRGV